MINSLIEKYKEEVKNCDEQIYEWHREENNGGDKNYENYCRNTKLTFKREKINYNRFIKDLEELKESIKESIDTCPADPQFLNYEELQKELIGE